MKTINLIQLLAIVLVIAFYSCNKKDLSISNEEMKAIVERCNEELGECFRSGDAIRLSLMYSDSAKLCPNGYDFVLGRENIQLFWAEDFKTSKVIEMKTNVLTLDGNREVIYETGITTSNILYMDSLYTPTVKYINVWRLQPDGNYLLDVDFWNKPKQ